jgi:hypothetical protein
MKRWIVKRTLKKLEKLMVSATINEKEDNYSFEVFGTKVIYLKYYFDKKLKLYNYSWEDYNKKWHIEFVRNPLKLCIYNKLDRFIAFYYTNMYIVNDIRDV